jgi:hypothetical protein
LKQKFVALYPWQFGSRPPKAFACQLIHKPFDRGAGYKLDAWTGELAGPFEVFVLDRWDASKNSKNAIDEKKQVEVLTEQFPALKPLVVAKEGLQDWTERVLNVGRKVWQEFSDAWLR